MSEVSVPVADDELVLTALRDGVLTLTLHNPPRRNAWSHPMEKRYHDLLEQAEVDPMVRVIVVTGHGTSFCPGLDAEHLATTASAGEIKYGHRRPQTLPMTIRKPIIAAINGGCAGIGLAQALYCDVRFAAQEAKFTTAYARRGLPAEYGTSWLLPRLIGLEAALDLLLSARTFNAEEAGRLGLVSRVVPRDVLLGEAQAYAADIAQHCSPTALAVIKRQIYGDQSRRLDESMVHTLGAMRRLAGSPDFVEGVGAFVERRTPNFAALDPTDRLDSELGYR